MDNIIFVLLSCAILADKSSADSTRFIPGNLTRIDWIGDSCTFKIIDESSPSQVPNYRLCKILEQAYFRSQPVVIEIRESSNKYYYGVSFPYRSANWADEKVETQSFQYQLFGTVEDVYYHAFTDNCHIAIDTGFGNIRNNKQFHMTKVWDICVKAINAFYSREKVLMISIVNLEKMGTNAIVDLKVTNCQ